MTDAAGLAISLAGTVLKLVIFSIDFVSDAKQVYRQGATDHNIDLATIVKSVEDATTTLDEQLDAIGQNDVGDKSGLDPDEEHLRELSLRAADIGRGLAQKLKRVTIDEKSKWKSFKAVILGMWDADEIQNTEKRLNGIKDEMQFRILVSMRNKVDQAHDDNNSSMLAALEEVVNHQARSKEDSKCMIKMLNNADKVGERRHEELIKLGNQLLDEINAVSTLRSPSPIPPIALTGIQSEQVREHAERTILNSLWYASIRDREESIYEAHAKTFQWVFEDPAETGKPWDSFADFLAGDASSYWVTGKPGSGKSTLMKFINECPQTQVLLEHWAGKRTLIKASYYFFYNGEDFQKSEYGLLRSLLHSILDQRRDLIPIAFKDRFQAALEGRKYSDPSLPETKRALKNVILHCPDTCFFLSLDGLDEFDSAVSLAHVQSLIDFTHFLEDFRNVKILISSRPLPEFERGYEGRPSLRVHELTKDDIRQYAMERLMTHQRMQNLTERDPRKTEDLLQSIVESSLGVFLWVRLVTDSLIQGLTNHDGISELQKRLEGLPSDLQALYRAMLWRVDASYRCQTAQLLSLVYYHAKEGQGWKELSLLDLWFAEKADGYMVHHTQIKPFEDEEVQERVEDLESRLKSRCLGLIEVVPTKISDEDLKSYEMSRESLIYDVSTIHRRATARFLHRSVFEFLSHDKVWLEFAKKYLAPMFTPSLSFLRSAILVMKTCRLASGANWTHITRLVAYAGLRAEALEKDTHCAHSDLIDELDLTMQTLIYTLELYPSMLEGLSNLGISSFPSAGCHWSVWLQCGMLSSRWGYIPRAWLLYDITHGSLMAFAAEYGLEHYMRHQLAKNGPKVFRKKGRPLLGYALLPFGHYSLSFLPQVQIVRLLLDKGADPNELYKETTLWDWYLWMLPQDRFQIPTFDSSISAWLCYSEYTETMEVMVLAGGNPNGRIRCFDNKHSPDPMEMTQSCPDALKCTNTPVRTILLALAKEQEWLNNHSHHNAFLFENMKKLSRNCISERIQKVINNLKERGAVEQEWVNKYSIDQLPNEINENINKEEPSTAAETSAVKEATSRIKSDTDNVDTLLKADTLSTPVVLKIPSDEAFPTTSELNQGSSREESDTSEIEVRVAKTIFSKTVVAETEVKRKWWKGWRKNLFRKQKQSPKASIQGRVAHL
ncbi:hypothetical protein F5Y19DRAFT_401525 [Xylariaceae sp. FL1651]|nr:hypothetical protein F5Y19DRAFT_401525 [Xylariaceae sp. FL1651]